MVKFALQRAACVVVLSIVLVLGTGCGVKIPGVQDPALKALSEFTAESVYPIALTYGRERQADAYLTSVVMAFPPGKIDEGPERISYEFSTPLLGNRQGWTWVDVYPKKGAVHLQVHQVAETEPRDYAFPLAFESATVHSMQALQMAEAAGGRAYREAHPDASVFVVSEWWADAEMVWTVRYGAESKPWGFDFWIHAQTGKVL